MHVFSFCSYVKNSGCYGNKKKDVNKTNLLTKFHEDRKKNVASRVLTRNNAQPLGSHFFQANIIIFELIQDIIETNLLTKCHEDWTINVASREKCPASDIIGTNLLTIFHQDWTINVASRVITRNKGQNCHKTSYGPDKLIPPARQPARIRQSNNQFFPSENLVKNAPRPRGHVFQPTGIIFELVQDIIGMNLLTKKHAPPLGSHVFQANATIFKLIQDIIETNLLTKFHEDWTINVASRELTRQMLTLHNAQRTKSDHKSSP
ncbi:hypothetical protein DPMN_126325 [Dreissena polymorpha]|uniref:Uncharacterized protein n=1 Tax=Dreissena polymorpha TaxID=45954 RepID=A0A9D4GZ56_DREPO|nr:hypothetical protein DPMN_126325 [Dreissena polymorpha]